MSRYIDADKFIEWLDVGHLRSPSEICYCEGDVKTMIDMQPTADVVEVVRCKDCKYLIEGMMGEKLVFLCKCMGGMVVPAPGLYCSYGKRKEQ